MILILTCASQAERILKRDVFEKDYIFKNKSLI